MQLVLGVHWLQLVLGVHWLQLVLAVPLVAARTGCSTGYSLYWVFTGCSSYWLFRWLQLVLAVPRVGPRRHDDRRQQAGELRQEQALGRRSIQRPLPREDRQPLGEPQVLRQAAQQVLPARHRLRWRECAVWRDVSDCCLDSINSVLSLVITVKLLCW